MKKLDKILLAFISLIGICFSVCMLSIFYPIPYIHNIVMDSKAVMPWLNYVFAGYCIVICFLFFVLLIIALFSPKKSDYLVIGKDKGKIMFSKKTIESTVRYSFADLEEISFSSIKVRINKKPEKTKVYVKLSLNDIKGLAALTENVQERIASALQSSLAITAKSIAIRVTEYKQNNVPKESHLL